MQVLPLCKARLVACGKRATRKLGGRCHPHQTHLRWKPQTYGRRSNGRSCSTCRQLLARAPVPHVHQTAHCLGDKVALTQCLSRVCQSGLRVAHRQQKLGSNKVTRRHKMQNQTLDPMMTRAWAQQPGLAHPVPQHVAPVHLRSDVHQRGELLLLRRRSRCCRNS
jgi:hypothetical protein